MANTLHVEVVSSNAHIFSGEAEFIVLPGEESQLGIYPRHAPLLTKIRPGEVRIRIAGQEKEELIFVAGGMLEVQPFEVTVLADSAIRSEDADEARAMQEKQAAEGLMKEKLSSFQFAKAESELALALMQLQYFKRMKGRG